MSRRAFLTGLGATLAVPLAASAQQAKTVYMVSTLSAASRNGSEHLLHALESELGRLGYAEGRNIAFEYRFANGKLERLPELAAELVNLKSDVIVAWAPPAAAAAKQATTSIPVVFLGVGGPIEQGLVKSLNRPGANVTGVAFWSVSNIAPKMLELAKALVPQLSRVAVLRPAEHTDMFLAEQEAAARSLNVHLVPVPFRNPSDVSAAFPAIAQSGAQALVITGGGLPWLHRELIVRLAARDRLPVIYGWREAVDAGGLMSLGADLKDIAARGAVYVDKILKGAKPANLPVEQPTKFELVINLKTAKALGLAIPPSLLARADEVIE